jgi:hypothetical protein
MARRVNSSCAPAYPRTYRLTIGSVAVPQRDRSGDCWDAACGAPDLKVVATLNGRVILTTRTAQDVFSATFDTGVTTQLTGGSELALDVYDEDLSSDDLALRCGHARLDGEDARGRSWRCGEGGFELSWTLIVQ